MQVLPSLISGGVERGAIEIAKFLVENGYESIVLSEGGLMSLELEQFSAKHIELNVQSKNPVNIIRNISKISNLLKEYKINILHARSRAPAWSCYYAVKKTPGVRFVTTVHGVYNFNNPIKKIYNSIMTKGDRVIAVSNFVKEYLLRNYQLNKNKIRVVPRGVDHQLYDSAKIDPIKQAKFRKKYNVPNGMPILLLPGRFTRWKGQMLLAQAINKIRNLEFYCIMVGDLAKHPAYVEEAKNYISDVKLQSKVQIFGSESDMFNLYGIADIVLSTSIEPEAFGRVVIEAQSMEKIVIAPDIGGTCETVQDAKSGFLFTATKADALANVITNALKIIGTQTHEDMISYARAFVRQNYSLENMQQKTLAVYKELL
jgi:glycosyltransferase involved in cell wall biosynthesis